MISDLTLENVFETHMHTLIWWRNVESKFWKINKKLANGTRIQIHIYLSIIYLTEKQHMEKGSGPESWNNIFGWRTSLTVSVKKKKKSGAWKEKKNQEDKENKTKIKTKQNKTCIASLWVFFSSSFYPAIDTAYEFRVWGRK